MRIVDVCAFYTPHGGGVRTYAQQKLRIGPRLGHEITIIAPGDSYEVVDVEPGARGQAKKRPRGRRGGARTIRIDFSRENPSAHRAVSPWLFVLIENRMPIADDSCVKAIPFRKTL